MFQKCEGKGVLWNFFYYLQSCFFKSFIIFSFLSCISSWSRFSSIFESIGTFLACALFWSSYTSLNPCKICIFASFQRRQYEIKRCDFILPIRNFGLHCSKLIATYSVNFKWSKVSFFLIKNWNWVYILMSIIHVFISWFMKFDFRSLKVILVPLWMGQNDLVSNVLEKQCFCLSFLKYIMESQMYPFFFT